jgi:hypothetical protein
VSKTHAWFGTKDDADRVLAWLSEAGARLASGAPLEGDWEPDGRELILHFPSLGPIELWPSEIRLEDYEESSSRWKSAVLTKIRQQEEPHRPLIDSDKSAVAGMQLPELRDGRYWVAGQVWFPTSHLKETFPELNRICAV